MTEKQLSEYEHFDFATYASLINDVFGSCNYTLYLKKHAVVPSDVLRYLGPDGEMQNFFKLTWPWYDSGLVEWNPIENFSYSC